MSTREIWAARVAAEKERRRRAGAEPSLWKPYPDSPQSRAIESLADITGYGGQAGGGKTDWLLGLASTRHRRSVIYRREFGQLKGLLQRSRELFTGHARYNGQDLIWRGLPGDREIEFGAVQLDGDERKYQGRPHDFIGFDELPHFKESQFWFLLGWLRSALRDQRCRVGVTFNPPTNSKERWIIGLFAAWLDRKHPSPAMPGELRWYARIDGVDAERPDGEPFDHDGETIVPLSRTFFPAKLSDNPLLAATGYGAQLQSLPEPLRSQLLYGDFDAGVEDDQWQLIPTHWLEAAVERWRKADPLAVVKQTCMGMDVAHGGKDQTVLALRYGNYFSPLLKYPGKQTPNGSSAAELAIHARKDDSYINVDVIGYGASAHERLAEKPPEGHGIKANPVNFACKSEHTDRSGKYRMTNLRAEAYWRLRESLDPEGGDNLCLPDDPEMFADLTSPTYSITPSGIKIESKDEIKARLSRSPDCGDAIALAMLPDQSFRWGFHISP